MKKGFFITFEGAEGSGKSTQIKKTAQHLRRRGYDVVLLREPGGTRVSEAIREILLNPKHKEIVPQTELLLYLAARAQIVNEKILPAIKKGKVVICDRFEDSTLAYQGYGRGFKISEIETVSRHFVRGALKPDHTFLLNIPARQGMKRGGRHDRMEKQSFQFHDKVQRGFLKLARREPKRYTVLDSRRPIERVFQEIQKVLDRVL